MTSSDEALSRSLWEDEPTVAEQSVIARLTQIEDMHVHEGVGRRLDAIADEMILTARAGTSGIIALLVGPTGAGKSHNLDQFAARPDFMPFEKKSMEGLMRPLVHIEAPKPCTLKALGLHLWEDLTGYAFPVKRATEHAIWRAVVQQFNGQGVRFLVIDEFHHVIDGRNIMERRQVTETLKGLSNTAPFVLSPTSRMKKQEGEPLKPIIPKRPLQILLAGMPEVEGVVQENAQFNRRKYYVRIDPVGDNDKGIESMRKFLRLLEEKGGLDPMLSAGDMPRRFRKASRGYLGMTAFLVKRAARRALSRRRTSIDIEKDLGSVFEDITGAAPERNPFRITNLSALAASVSMNEAHMTRLRGSSLGSGQSDVQ